MIAGRPLPYPLLLALAVALAPLVLLGAIALGTRDPGPG